MRFIYPFLLVAVAPAMLASVPRETVPARMVGLTDSNCPEVVAMVKGGTFPSETTFLFIDKSGSLNASQKFALAKYQKQTQQLLNKHVHQAGDRLVVYQVHHATLTGEVMDKTFESNIPLNNICDKADKVIAALKSQYADELFDQSSNCRKAIKKVLNTPVGTASTQTDLWGSLQVIAEEKPKSSKINAYYFSDMVESMPGKSRRDLHKQYPKTIGEANQFAAEDLKRIRSVCSLNPALLKRLRLTIALPHSPDAPPSASKPYVKTYWQQLLAGLGIKEVEFV